MRQGWWGMAVLLLAACGDKSERASFSIDFAPATCGGAAVAVPDCVHIRVCEPGTFDAPEKHSCFPLVLTDGDHDEGSVDGVGVTVGADARVAFDGKLKGDRFDVEVIAYGADGKASAVGRARNVALSSATGVRVFPVGAAACASKDSPDERALHGSVLLPNGDVLIFGGVRGTGVGGTKFASFQPSIEVFHGSTSRFETVDAEPFQRVFFAATAVPSDGPPYRVRVYGGFAPSETTVAAVVVNPLGGDVLQAPVAPVAGLAEPAPVDLVYDPARNRVTVDEPDVDPRPAYAGAHGWATGSAGTADDKGVFYSLVAEGACWASSAVTPCADRLWEWLYRGDGAPSMSENEGLLRATAARVGPGVAVVGPQAVLFGGPIARSKADRAALAGAVIPRASGVAAVPMTVPLDAQVPAFLSLTPFGTDTVLAVGGVQSDCLEDCRFNHILSNQYVSTAVQVGKVGGDASVTWTPSDLAPYQASILHTATPVAVAGGTTSQAALLTGGTDEASPGVLGYGARDQVVLVRYDGTAFAVDDLGGQVPAHLAQGRWGHTAVALPDERVLILGGFTAVEPATSPATVQAIAAPEMLTLGLPAEVASACTVSPGG